MTAIPPTPVPATPVQPTAPLPGTIAPGQTYNVMPKNPLQSTAIWGLLIMVITFVVNKYVPATFRDQTVAAATEALIFAAGAGFSLYGRWTANRPLSLSPKVAAQTTIK